MATAKMSQPARGAAQAIRSNVSVSTIKRVAKPRTVKFTGDNVQYRLK